jgi:hypothetical protein
VSDDDGFESIHGSVEDVVKSIIHALVDGTMSVDQAAELVAGLAGHGAQKRHDVSVAFRVALIAQGFETEALLLREVWMTLTPAGAMFQYAVDGRKATQWIDEMEEGLSEAFLKASVVVLRAGYINADTDPETNRIRIMGSLEDDDVSADDVEALVSEFVEELDREFPDKPPPRKGTWW